jgi:hypothetical protein
MGVMILVTSLIGNVLFEKISENDQFSTGEGSAEFAQLKSDTLTISDWAFPAGAMLMYFAVIAFAFLTPNHPIFAAASIGLLIIGSLILPSLANVYLTFAANDSLTTVAAQMPITQAYVENGPIIFLMAGIAMLVAMNIASQRQ